MAMAFGGSGGYFDVTYAKWSVVLDLARHYGWVPARTEPPDGVPSEDWSGTYCSSDGQLITSDDAACLANAIEAFLDGQQPKTLPVPDTDPDSGYFKAFTVGVLNNFGVNSAGSDDTRASPNNWTDTELGRNFLQRLVNYCRAGEFRLW